MKLILASASPRRKELLTVTGVKFDVVVSDADETVSETLTPAETVTLLARRKAEAVRNALGSPDGDTVILAADTVVASGGKILGKPKDREDAKNMLRSISGRVHEVYTGVALVRGEKTASGAVSTAVSVRPIPEDEIERYAASGECDDKAGAYAIQGIGGLFVEKIDGDYRNVVGLPVYYINELLKSDFGLSLWDFMN